MAWTVESKQVAYCPTCGESLETRELDDQSVPRCVECDLTLYRNPIPMGRATVIDGDSALLIERGRGADIGEWVLPGGHLEYDEPPRVGAARELEEETGLSVRPEDLTLVGDGFLDFGDGLTMVSFNYAVSRDVVDGTVRAGDDAADARFWSRDELRTNTPLLRASGLEQVLAGMDELNRT